MTGGTLGGRVRSAAPIAATAKPSKRTVGVTSEAPSIDIFLTGTDDGIVRRLDVDGNEVWSYTAHTTRVTGLTFDSDERVYTSSWDETAAKLDPDGNEIWRNSFATGGDGINDVVVASDGTIRLGGADNKVRKLGSDGSLIWAHTLHNDGVNGVAVDNNGNVYSCDAAGKVIKADTDGNQVWTVSLTGGAAISAVSVSSDGTKIWAGGGDWNVYRLDGSGSIVWTFTSPAEAGINDISADSDGNVYSIEGFPDYAVRKIDSNGNQVWEFTGHTSTGSAVDVSNISNVISGSWDNTSRKLDSEGNQVWSNDYSTGVTAVAAQ